MKMQLRKYTFIMIILSGLITLWSCEYEKIQPDLPPTTDTVYYAADIQPIWNSGCNGCHGAGMTAPDLSAANSFQSLTNGNFIKTENPSASKIYTVMATGGSMSQYSSTAEANLVLVWIQQGAKNN